MSAIFRDTADLQRFVKVNNSANMDVFDTFVEDAKSIFVEKQIGKSLMDGIETYAGGERTEGDGDDLDSFMSVLLLLTQRAVAPLAMMLGMHEMSVGIGDSGHTVTKTDKLLPASDSKIANVGESFAFRGFKALDRLLAFVDENREKAIGFEFTVPDVPGGFISTIQQFEKCGMVDIESSLIAFGELLPTMVVVSATDVRGFLGHTLYKDLFDNINNAELSDVKKKLIDLIRAYIPPVTLLRYSKNMNISNKRLKPFMPKFSPDAAQLDQLAENARADIIQYLNENSSALGYPTYADWRGNSKTNKIFIA